MRRCFYHTDLVQNAVFHNLSRQIAFIQYSGPSKHAWTFKNECRYGLSKIGNGQTKPSLILFVKLVLQMKLLTVAFG